MLIEALAIKPLIENVDPLLLYQYSTPDAFSLQENPILYGGGRGWALRPSALGSRFFASFIQNQLGAPPSEAPLEADVFVMNSAFVFWLTQYNVGASVPYQKIVLHALQKTPQGDLLLYIQIQDDTCEDALIDFEIEPKKTFVPDPAERLFTKEHFGSFVSADRIVETTFTALSRCSALHFDPDSDPEDEPVLEVGEVHVDTVGQADDIGDDGPQGGMRSGVEVSLSARSGVVREREADNEDGGDKGKVRRV